MNWISHWKKIGIKVKQILKKQPTGQEENDWKNCPQCKKISYLPDLITNSYICECSFHFDLPPKMRLDNLFDSSYEISGASRSIAYDLSIKSKKSRFNLIDPSSLISTIFSLILST